MAFLPSGVRDIIEAELQMNIREVERIGGGSINEALLLRSNTGTFFLKYNTGAFAGPLFAAEVQGLNCLAENGKVQVPQIYLQESVGEHSFLLLEYLEPGREDRSFWERFGQSLADLHRITAPQFGLDHDNFIGRLPQSNQLSETWEAFYWEQRLWPQIRMACDAGQMSAADAKAFEDFYNRIAKHFPKEAPALLHGDLWSGNYLATTTGLPVLIDPAVCFAHREMDLAMTRLFGGFSPYFYAAYQEAFPLTPGFEERVGWYQLYYLLVHVNLFGQSYMDSVRKIIYASPLKR